MTGERKMKVTTLRVSEPLHAAIVEEAELDRVSVSQFLRESALARLAYERARRAHQEGADPRDLAAIVDRTIRELLRP